MPFNRREKKGGNKNDKEIVVLRGYFGHGSGDLCCWLQYDRPVNGFDRGHNKQVVGTTDVCEHHSLLVSFALERGLLFFAKNANRLTENGGERMVKRDALA